MIVWRSVAAVGFARVVVLSFLFDGSEIFTFLTSAAPTWARDDDRGRWCLRCWPRDQAAAKRILLVSDDDATHWRRPARREDSAAAVGRLVGPIVRPGCDQDPKKKPGPNQGAPKIDGPQGRTCANLAVHRRITALGRSAPRRTGSVVPVYQEDW
jgi:hypothetical protein